FAPSQPNTMIGRLTRCHVTTPHIWEDVGAPPIPASNLAGSQGDGSFSVCFFPEINKFVAYTCGTGRGSQEPEGIIDYVAGRVWVWGFGDPTWELLGRTQSCGFSGEALYNPVKKEVLLYGGSNAYANPHKLYGGECMATIDANGVFRRHGPTGLFYSTGNRRLTYHPVTGDYIMTDQVEATG